MGGLLLDSLLKLNIHIISKYQRTIRKELNMPETRTLWNIRQAAEFMAVSTSFLYRAVENGEINCYRLGRAIRFTQDDINTFIQQRQYAFSQPYYCPLPPCNSYQTENNSLNLAKEKQMQYRQFYDEWNTRQSGIDTISIWIHPKIVMRPDAFHERGNIHDIVNLHIKTEGNHGKGMFIRRNYIIDIQSEAINHDEDILEQVLLILVNLAWDGILLGPPQFDRYQLLSYFNANFNELFAIEGIDFYNDVFSDDMELAGNNPKYPGSRYSHDYPSSLKAYKRDERLRHKRQIPFETIDNMRHTGRIEFMLRRRNCPCLFYRNLSGNYDTVFNRFLPILARKWQRNRHDVLTVPHCQDLEYAPYLQQIIMMAQDRIPQYRDTLRKAPTKPIPFKHSKKNETDREYPADFLRNMTTNAEI
jgi:excisionase family DNA binding protein